MPCRYVEAGMVAVACACADIVAAGTVVGTTLPLPSLRGHHGRSHGCRRHCLCFRRYSCRRCSHGCRRHCRCLLLPGRRCRLSVVMVPANRCPAVVFTQREQAKNLFLEYSLQKIIDRVKYASVIPKFSSFHSSENRPPPPRPVLVFGRVPSRNETCRDHLPFCGLFLFEKSDWQNPLSGWPLRPVLPSSIPSRGLSALSRRGGIPAHASCRPVFPANSVLRFPYRRLRCNFYRICEVLGQRERTRPALFLRESLRAVAQDGQRLAYPAKIA